MASKVDITNWRQKVRNVKAVEAAAVKSAVDYGLDVLNKAVIKNLTGPHYGFRKSGRSGEGRTPIRGPMTNAGKLPVPVVTGLLRRSIKTTRLSTVLGAVWSDPRVANYNAFVHDGTKRMKPRRYLSDAVNERRPAIYNHWKYYIAKEIRKAGGAI